MLAAAVLVYVEQSTGFQFDDAWITYRYAENLAAGNGLVYNTGEYVEGSTAPLLVLLLSLFRWLGISIPAASLPLIPASLLDFVGIIWLRSSRGLCRTLEAMGCHWPLRSRLPPPSGSTSSYVLVHGDTPIVSTGGSIEDPRRDTTYT